MDINQLMNEINNPRLKNALQNATKNEEGQQLMKSLKSADKAQLIGLMNKINTNKVPTEEIIRQLETNPDIIKKINNMLNRKWFYGQWSRKRIK